MKVNVLVDSSVWIEYFTGGPKAKKVSPIILKANKATYRTPAIVLFEVYKKIKKELNEETANLAISQIIDLTEIIKLDERIAVHAAETGIETGLAMADAIIKATAEINDAEIKTMDRHFKNLENTEII